MADESTKTPENTANLSVKELAIRWLLGQEATVVLLFANIFGMVYITKYALDTAIPGHIKSIQEGYQANANTLKEAVERCCGDKDRLLDMIEGKRRQAAGADPAILAGPK